MDVSLISIGNSKGIRLSKTLIEKYNFQDTIELILEKGFIILKPKTCTCLWDEGLPLLEVMGARALQKGKDEPCEA